MPFQAFGFANDILSQSQLDECIEFGYRFGYRHQFGLVSANYAKLLVGMGLAGSLITLNFPYLSKIYGVLGKLKIRRGQPRGGSTPSRHQDNKRFIRKMASPK
jgi:hypothetical protein